MRICLPMQGTQVQSLIGELKIPLAAGQLSPHATTSETACCNYRAHVLWSLHATTREKSTRRNKRSRVLQPRPDAAKNI